MKVLTTESSPLHTKDALAKQELIALCAAGVHMGKCFFASKGMHSRLYIAGGFHMEQVLLCILLESSYGLEPQAFLNQNRCLEIGKCKCFFAGKGMHSRLYTRVLNQFPWMVNCTAISSLYNETGIFSIFASAESASADEMVNVLCKELQVRNSPHMVYVVN